MKTLIFLKLLYLNIPESVKRRLSVIFQQYVVVEMIYPLLKNVYE